MSNLTQSQQRLKVLKEKINSNSFLNGILGILGGDTHKLNIFKSSLLTIASEPNLNDCSIASILESAKNIAELDLSLNKLQGQAYIVRYGKADGKAQAIIGYKGYIELAKRAGVEIKARSVFKCDHFRIDASHFNEILEFLPNYDERDETDKVWFAENFRGVLVMSKDFTTKSESFDFVNSSKLYKIAGMSPSLKGKKPEYSPYANWGEEMYWAKAVKYVVARMPLGEKISRAIAIDNLVDIPLSKEAIKTLPNNNVIDSILSDKPVEKELPQDEIVQESYQVDSTTGEVIIPLDDVDSKE